MKNYTLLSVALAVSILGTATLPAFAQTYAVAPAPVTSQAPAIPQSAAITIAFPSEIMIDAKEQKDYPTTAVLAQPIYDNYGNAVVPANSPISVRLIAAEGGARIVADSLIIRGQVFPVQASSVTIPGIKVSQVSAKQQAQDNSSIYSHMLGGLGGALGSFGGNGENTTARAMQGSLLGMGLGTLTGMTSAKKALVVKIPQGSVYVLTLQAPIALGPATPQVATSVSAPAPQFSFKTVEEYSTGLNQVLQAYNQGKISKDQALSAIKAANLYATTQLSTPLLPPATQRQEIHQLFNFAY